MTPAESAEMDRRAEERQTTLPATRYAKTLDGSAGVYIDQRRGGMPVFLFTDSIAERRDTITSKMPKGVGFEVLQVEYDMTQLRAKQADVTKDIESMRWVLDGDIPIAQVGVGVKANRVLVGLEQASRAGLSEIRRRV